MASIQFERLKREAPISRDANYNAMLRRVGERIAYVAAPDMPNAQWEFVVFDDPGRVNAFAMHDSSQPSLDNPLIPHAPIQGLARHRRRSQEC